MQISSSGHETGNVSVIDICRHSGSFWSGDRPDESSPLHWVPLNGAVFRRTFEFRTFLVVRTDKCHIEGRLRVDAKTIINTAKKGLKPT